MEKISETKVPASGMTFPVDTFSTLNMVFSFLSHLSVSHNSPIQWSYLYNSFYNVSEGFYYLCS